MKLSAHLGGLKHRVKMVGASLHVGIPQVLDLVPSLTVDQLLFYLCWHINHSIFKNFIYIHYDPLMMSQKVAPREAHMFASWVLPRKVGKME